MFFMAMDWKNQLTKTPVLIFFILLGGIGVGTASALITITLSGDVHVIGDTTLDGRLTVGGDFPPVSYNRIGGGATDVGLVGVNSLLITDDLEVDSDVFVADDLFVNDLLTIGGVFPAVSYNRIGSGVTDVGLVGVNSLLISDDLEVNDDVFVEGDLFVDGKINGVPMRYVKIEDDVAGHSIGWNPDSTAKSHTINLGLSKNSLVIFSIEEVLFTTFLTSDLTCATASTNMNNFVLQDCIVIIEGATLRLIIFEPGD